MEWLRYNTGQQQKETGRMKIISRGALRRVAGGGGGNSAVNPAQTDGFCYDDNGTNMETK
jgi:hypothetical protein